VLPAHTEHVAAAADKEASGPKLPAAQGVPEHAEEPDADEKVPAAHWEQLEAPVDEKLPAAHSVQLEVPADEKEPNAHNEQLEAPASEKLPATH
jgi:hypothetical protein